MGTMTKGRYVNVTKEQMESALQVGQQGGFRKAELNNGTIELVYQRVYHGEGDALYAVRVFTGINPDGISRAVGKDAIKVEVYWKPNQKPETKAKRIGGCKRINRVPGWSARLKDRIDTWEKMIGPNCPKCGGPMVVRKVKSGVYRGATFFGCCNYPTCTCTLNIKVDPELEE